MATKEELEKRIETLEKEVQHLKAILQYQMRNKKKWFIFIRLQLLMVSLNNLPLNFFISKVKDKIQELGNIVTFEINC